MKKLVLFLCVVFAIVNLHGTPSFQITFDANGGAGGIVLTVDNGDVPTPPTVTRVGYTFVEWSPAIVAATEDATYTAQWTINTYQITFDADGGVGGTVLTVDHGDVPVPPVVTKVGYTFVEWTPAIVAATEDATYTAQWTINTYQITFDADGGVGGNVLTVDHGDVPTPPVVTKVGYTFVEWTPAIVAATEDATYTAQWEVETTTYQITFDANGGVGGEVQTVVENVVPTPPVVTKVGYTFVEWTPAIVAATEDATYTAQWEVEPTTYQITFDANGGVGGEVQTVVENVVPTPPTVTKVGYTFIEWTPAIVAATEDATYTAQWEVIPTTYQITFDANGGEGGEVQTVVENVVPTPPVVTRAGYTFVEWTPAIVAATEDATYTAQWEVVTTTYQLTIAVNPVGAGSVVGTGAYTEGTVVNLSTTPLNGNFIFVNWKEGTNILSTNPNYAYTMPARNVTLLATYRFEVSIAENELNSINVYPNPSQGLYNVEVAQVYNMQVVDVTGRIVLAQEIQAGVTSLDLQAYNNGVYFIRLISENQIQTIRVVKQ